MQLGYRSVSVDLHGNEYMALLGATDKFLALQGTVRANKARITRQFTDGEYVISEFVMRGTHGGLWLGIQPTGRVLEFNGVDIDRVRDGRIIEHGGAVNTFETLWQQGLIGPR